MIRYIYTFFLGLFLVIFVGLGIAVFYSQPKAPEPPIFSSSSSKMGQLTEAEILQEQQYNVQQRAYDNSMKHYNRNVSMIVLVSAVIILAVSLLGSGKIGLLADGLLLGGIFTLLYCIGRGLASDNNVYKFLIATLGLIITIILGYIKFLNNKPPKSLKQRTA